MKEVLNIITAVSRPENLFILKENIQKEILPYFDVQWYCIYDIGKDNPIVEFEEPWIISQAGGIPHDCAGGSQRNIALELIKEGWVCFLDDDNLIYDGYGEIMSKYISSNPTIGAYIVNQKHVIGNLIAKPKNMRLGKLDMAQALIHIDTIAHYRFFENVYQSDYFFIKHIYKRDKSKFAFIDRFLCHYNYLRKKVVQFVHYVDGNNTGDMQSCPLEHFSMDVEVRRTHIYEIEKLYTTFPVIIGGGGLLQQGPSVEHVQKIISTNKSNVILWAVGVNTNLKGNNDFISTEIKRASLVGIRDIGFFGFDHLPCVSCLHPAFDKEYEIKNDIVCFEGNRLNLPLPSMCCLDGKSMEEIIEFLGTSRTIVTSSYHGMYWGVLLKREVIVIPNADSSKFFHFPYPLARTDINSWQDFVGKGEIYPDALKECREANILFSEKVNETLNIKMLPK